MSVRPAPDRHSPARPVRPARNGVFRLKQERPNDNVKFRQCLGPRSWLVWPLLGLLWIAARLPYRWQLRGSRPMGRLCHRVASTDRREAMRRNLAICFPERDEAERESLLRAHFQAMGMAFFEIGVAWWLPAPRLAKRFRVTGAEHLEKARRDGTGVILLTAHFTTMELCGRLLGTLVPFHPLYRPTRIPAVQWLMKRARRGRAAEAIARHDLRGMVRHLRAGDAVWYPPDQTFRGMSGVMAPFFGRPAPTITATSRIARIGGARVVPVFCERLPGREGYRLRILPALADFPSEDETADAARVNRVIEEQIRRVPEQYMWVYDRFRTDVLGQALDPHKHPSENAT